MSMSLRRSRILLLWLACCFVLCVAAGCDAPDETPPLPALPTPQAATVNVIHASSDAPALDVYLDDKPLTAGLGYRKSSGNLTTTPGVHKLELRASGQDATAMPLSSDSLYLQEGQKLLITAVGRIADGDAATAFHIVATTFGNGDNQLRLRVLNAAPSRPKLDVTSGSDLQIFGIEFGTISPTTVTKWNPSSAVTADLAIAATGKSAAQSLRLGQASLQGTFANSSLLTLVALGEENPLFDATHFFGLSLFDESNGTLQDLPFVPSASGPAANICVYQASSDSQAIDIYADNGARIVGGLAYNMASNLVALPPGVYTIQLRASGAGTVLGTMSLKLLPGTQWALFTTGLRGTAPAGRGFALYAAPIAQKGSDKRWRVIHTALAADALALEDAGQKPLLQVDYAKASSYRQDVLPVGTLKLHAVANPAQIWNIDIPQSFVDSVRDEVTTLYLTGSITNAAQPLQAVALVESTASATRTPTLTSLSTTK